MNILSLQLGHNATAALLVDGVIVGAVSQEKFDNSKNSAAFPDRPTQWLLSRTGLTPKDIDQVAIAGLNIFPHQMLFASENGRGDHGLIDMATLWRRLDYRYGGQPGVGKLLQAVDGFRRRRSATQGRQLLLTELRQRYGFTPDQVRFVEHHVCHSYTTYYALRESDEPALVLTMDGAGDYYFATVNVVRNGRFERLASSPWRHSLGYVYSYTTRFLGMKPLEHEYKVMGLAPYAKGGYQHCYEEIFKPVIRSHPQNPLCFDSAFPLNRFDQYLREKAVGERFDNIAAAVQQLTEDVVLQWVKTAIQRTGIRTVFTCGGVFMNVKLNMRIQELPEVERVYFMPSCGDESNPFGAAYHTYIHDRGGKEPQPLSDLYLGPEYTNEEIAAFLRSHEVSSRYQVTLHENIEQVIAKLLADQKIVARFVGRAEWGARSLGNRSLLGHPSFMETFYEVNDQIKSRDFWMPFAPTILVEDADLYLINPKHIRAPHMITAFRSTPLGQQHFRAAIHQADKTLRPQILQREANPRYYDLIRHFKELTGVGGVLNTSFNLHGYPLVATPEQALFTFEHSGLCYLAMENYLISKNKVA